MKVIWSSFAEHTLADIYNYYRDVADIIVAKRIKSEILAATKLLIKHSNSGQVEELLKQLEEGHRYLVIGHHKIIYKHVEEGILITDVFDTRQNPIKINNPERK
ncbi:MAG: type II toxin-antitoxin system RelE/ParE family toxin [Bacteroidota bacterium]|nr:type II toxin-antitoxin system RelE/ParE family toxin [Bacteroidota bacterium]MDP3432329.1 type II toxin-antitoxin system RelE/ParE family toxin [Bacteroidota bacterium]